MSGESAGAVPWLSEEERAALERIRIALRCEAQGRCGEKRRRADLSSAAIAQAFASLDEYCVRSGLVDETAARTPPLAPSNVGFEDASDEVLAQGHYPVVTDPPLSAFHDVLSPVNVPATQRGELAKDSSERLLYVPDSYEEDSPSWLVASQSSDPCDGSEHSAACDAADALSESVDSKCASCEAPLLDSADATDASSGEREQSRPALAVSAVESFSQGASYCDGSLASWGHEVIERGNAIMRLLHDAALRSDCAPAAEETRSSEPVAVLQPEEEAAVEEAPPLAYTGAPLVLAAPDASPETLALLRRCGDLGWVERMRAPSVEADPAQAVLLLADTLQRRSARRLCARTLTYARFLSLGRWIVDSAFLLRSLQDGRLHFPSGSFSEDMLRESLEKFEIGGTTVDFVLNSPRRRRQQVLGRGGRGQGLFRGYRIVIVHVQGRAADGAHLSPAQLKGLVELNGSHDVEVLEMSALDHAEAPLCAADQEGENTCAEEYADEAEGEGGQVVIGVDMCEPIPLSSIRSRIVRARNSAVEAFLTKAKCNFLAVVSAEWIFDAVCNQRVSRDFRYFSQ